MATLKRLISFLIPYNGFISLGANFPEFPELDHNSGKFMLGSFYSSVVGLVLYNCACISSCVRVEFSKANRY